MSLTLILTRHAKSSWSNANLDDFDRPLNGRGKHSATAIGDWLAAEGHVPEEVILSGAKRTLETWAGIEPRLPKSAHAHTDRTLYLGAPEAILAALRGATAPVTMLIGHNPGIASFANTIVQKPADHPRFRDYPTCATTIIDFDVAGWGGIDWGMGVAQDFVVPRDLIG